MLDHDSSEVTRRSLELNKIYLAVHVGGDLCQPMPTCPRSILILLEQKRKILLSWRDDRRGKLTQLKSGFYQQTSGNFFVKMDDLSQNHAIFCVCRELLKAEDVLISTGLAFPSIFPLKTHWTPMKINIFP